MAAMALPSFATTQVKGKKEKSPKKVLLKTQQEAFSADPTDTQPAYLLRNGLEPIHEDEEHFTTIAPPPGLEKNDDDFSDSLWSRSTTGGSGFETQSEEEVDDAVTHAALAEQIAKLSAMQIQETMASMYYNNLSTSPQPPMQASGESAFASSWTQMPVRNFCPWCGCKRAAYYTFCPNCGNKLDE
ncbi:unnamed protein product [Symbiodinium pilosum]|uniref:Zinc-ribbon domain-containing protein n=1 Tax=Symbiodinium pilosum TaxID=2952 RepID=A0A812W0C4_SYMPI|nr:unnamed protein product [Symbiodinium pilosum]